MEQSPWLLPETFFDDIGRQHWALQDGALTEKALQVILTEHQKHKESYTKAGVGRHSLASHIEENIRSDRILWVVETNPAWEIIESLRQQLESQLRVALLDFESHFTIYDPGGKYEKHLDQFTKNAQAFQRTRQLSFILYLNANWKPADGGELKIYDANDRPLHTIQPKLGRLVVFRSDTIPHEVCATHSPRYSLTGWMRK